MVFQAKIKVLEKTSKAYAFEGKNGTSHKVRALVEDDIFSFKFGEEDLGIFNAIPEKGEIDVKISLTAPKEMVKVSIVEILKLK